MFTFCSFYEKSQDGLSATLTVRIGVWLPITWDAPLRRGFMKGPGELELPANGASDGEKIAPPFIGAARPRRLIGELRQREGDAVFEVFVQVVWHGGTMPHERSVNNPGLFFAAAVHPSKEMT